MNFNKGRCFCLFVWLGFNATFNNISVISRRSVLLVEEAGVPVENHRPWAGNWQTLSRAMRVKHNPFLYGTNQGANSRRIGDRIQWSVQVNLNQLPRPLGHSSPSIPMEFIWLQPLYWYKSKIFFLKQEFPEAALSIQCETC